MKKKIGLLVIIYCMFLLNSCNNGSNEAYVENENSYVKENSIEKTDVENTNEVVEISTVNNENIQTTVVEDTRTVVKERDYRGRVGNSDIHMTLKYYDDGTVDGSYFYDKYQTDILVHGTKEYDTITLYNDELNETFEGFIGGTFINGDWQNSVNSEKFFVWNENYDDFKMSYSTIKNDNKNFYFYDENSIYKSDFDGSNITKVYEDDSTWVWNLSLYSKYIYYLTYEDQLCRIDTNGLNKEIIIDDSVCEYSIYKDKIYYTTYEMDTLLFNSADLLGNRINAIEIPKYYEENGEEKVFHLDSIYNDYVYFVTWNLAGSSLFRMKIDGSDKIDFGLFPDIIGFAGNKMIIQKNTTEINAINTENFDELETLYDKVDFHFRTLEIEYYSVMNNENYIVFAYQLFGESIYNCTVLSTDGEILNEIKFDLYDAVSVYILNDYIYLFGDYDEGLIARINMFGDEIEFINGEN